MISMDTFLTEAKFSSKSINKVTQLMRILIQKRISKKIYQMGGEGATYPVKGGVGYLFVFKATNGNRAFRLNWIQNEIKSVTIWRNFKIGNKGDFTVTFDGLNIVETMDKIIDVILTPKAGMHPTYKPISENFDFDDESLLTEAKRVTPLEFAKAIGPYLAPGESLTSLTFNRIQAMAILADVNIPTIIRSSGRVSGKGANAKFDVTLSHLNPADRATEPKPNQVEPLYYVKVTKQDPITKKFQSIKDDQQALFMTKSIKQAMENPTEQQMTQQMLDPKTKFGHMASLVKMVSKGNLNALVVTGGPGIGKSFVVTKTLKESGRTEDKDFFVYKGKITTASLFQTLFIHKNGKVVVFDDADSMWGDSEAVNLLKAALDTNDVRYISWVTNRTVNVAAMDEHERHDYIEDTHKRLLADPADPKIKLPSKFRFDGRVIFISNLPSNKLDSAVLSRSVKIEMNFTTEQIFDYMESILANIGEPDVSLSAKKEILDFLRKDYKGLEVSLRTFVQAEKAYKSGLPEWKELLQYMV